MDINNVSESEVKETIAKRIWRYKFYYIITIPAMLYLILVKFIPLIWGIKLPFTAYNPLKGIANSKYIGLQNFMDLFSQSAFSKVLLNTLELNVGFVIVCSIIAYVLIYSLSRLSSKRILAFFTTIFLIPLFIPL